MKYRIGTTKQELTHTSKDSSLQYKHLFIQHENIWTS